MSCKTNNKYNVVGLLTFKAYIMALYIVFNFGLFHNSAWLGKLAHPPPAPAIVSIHD